MTGGKSFGSIAHWQPVPAMYWMAFQTSRSRILRGRPTREGGGMNGSTIAHSASVQSLAYRVPLRTWFRSRRSDSLSIRNQQRITSH